MNGSEYPSEEHPSEDPRIDRLVDGELDAAEYRALLAQLDDEPGGWRNCALAFLEAQAWRKDLTLVRGEMTGDIHPASDAAPKHRAATGRRWKAPLLMLAMAASFLVAFGLGTTLQPIWSLHDSGGAAVEGIAGAQPGPAAPTAIAEVPVESPAPPAWRQDVPRAVTLVVNGDNAASREVDVPLYTLEDVDEDFLSADRTAIPPEIQEFIRQSGHRLLRERRLVPMDLGDGRQVVVPIEDVQIVPIGRPPL